MDDNLPPRPCPPIAQEEEVVPLPAAAKKEQEFVPLKESKQGAQAAVPVSKRSYTRSSDIGKDFLQTYQLQVLDHKEAREQDRLTMIK